MTIRRIPLIISFQHEALSTSQIYIRWIRSLLLIIFRDLYRSLLGGAFLREDVRQGPRFPARNSAISPPPFLTSSCVPIQYRDLCSLADSTALKAPRLSCFVIHIETSWRPWRKARFSTNGSAECIDLKLAASTPCGVYMTDSAFVGDLEADHNCGVEVKSIAGRDEWCHSKPARQRSL